MKKLMKTLSLVMAAALTFGLAACEKTSELTEIDTALLHGQWDVNTAIMAYSMTGAGPDMDISENDTLNFQPGDATFTFNADNTLTVSYIDEETNERTTETSPYTISGANITINASSIPGASANPALASSKLVMTVTTLTETNLEMGTTFNQSFNGISVNMDVQMALTKSASN